MLSLTCHLLHHPRSSHGTSMHRKMKKTRKEACLPDTSEILNEQLKSPRSRESTTHGAIQKASATKTLASTIRCRANSLSLHRACGGAMTGEVAIKSSHKLKAHLSKRGLPTPSNRYLEKGLLCSMTKILTM